MSFYNQHAYKVFEKTLLNKIKKKENTLILSVPGLGYTHFSEKFVKKNIDVRHIKSSSEVLSSFNILDLDFDIQNDALEVCDGYLRSATKDQKFAVIINDPSIIDTEKYLQSKTATRMYSTFLFKARNEVDTKNFALEVNKKLADEQIKTLFEISGGIGRIIKYLAFSPEKMELPLDVLTRDKHLLAVLESTLSVIAKCDDDVLSSLGIIDKSGYVSKYVASYFKNNPDVRNVSIFVSSDLTLKENGVRSKNKLTKVEKEVLDCLLGDPVITREKVADIKWGEGSYDKYSDQAINKTMQRLNKKFQRHELIRVPKVGYKIVAR